MKKITTGLLLTALLLCGCSQEKKAEQTQPEETNAPHQVLTAQQATFDPAADMRVDIPQVGLSNVLVCNRQKSRLEGETRGYVYLVADDRYNGESHADYYLLVAVENQLAAVDLGTDMAAGAMGVELTLADVDGDGDSEILTHEGLGATGGAGQYRSRIFDYQAGQLLEMFQSDGSDRQFDTGFSVTLQLGQRYEIYNQATNYSQAFVLTDRPDAYFQQWYNEDGTVAEHTLWVDNFCKFEPVDADGDGVYEIECVQYTSLMDHTDFMGWAYTIIKYDEIAGEFRIIDAWFMQK